MSSAHFARTAADPRLRMPNAPTQECRAATSRDSAETARPTHSTPAACRRSGEGFAPIHHAKTETHDEDTRQHSHLEEDPQERDAEGNDLQSDAVRGNGLRRSDRGDASISWPGCRARIRLLVGGDGSATQAGLAGTREKRSASPCLDVLLAGEECDDVRAEHHPAAERALHRRHDRLRARGHKRSRLCQERRAAET